MAHGGYHFKPKPQPGRCDRELGRRASAEEGPSFFLVVGIWTGLGHRVGHSVAKRGAATVSTPGEGIFHVVTWLQAVLYKYWAGGPSTRSCHNQP